MHKQKRLLLVFCPEDYFEVIFHKPVLIFTIGVSASGKSTWSKQIQAQYAMCCHYRAGRHPHLFALVNHGGSQRPPACDMAYIHIHRQEMPREVSQQ